MLKKWLCLLVIPALPFFMFSPWLFAESSDSEPTIKYAAPEGEAAFVAKLNLHTTAEVEQMLKRAEMYVENIDQYPDFEPITVILHGPELRAFDRRNYKEFKEIVGLAARLEAFNIINVQVCEVQMMQDGISPGDLPAFVEMVPYGPAEEERLIKRGYQYF